MSDGGSSALQNGDFNENIVQHWLMTCGLMSESQYFIQFKALKPIQPINNLAYLQA